MFSRNTRRSSEVGRSGGLKDVRIGAAGYVRLKWTFKVDDATVLVVEYIES
jgi:hypothetical protein